jgi:glucuronate isomerase
MKPFIHDDFLLHSAPARELYHRYAEKEPIFDYHCHLSPRLIAENHRFADLAEIWLGGDHYKWRAMRADGVAERLCTGDASPREKFDAWCSTVPRTLRNPLYHWSHLELKRYFGIDALIGPTTADEIWERANARLSTLLARGSRENSEDGAEDPRVSGLPARQGDESRPVGSVQRLAREPGRGSRPPHLLL